MKIQKIIKTGIFLFVCFQTTIHKASSNKVNTLDSMKRKNRPITIDDVSKAVDNLETSFLGKDYLKNKEERIKNINRHVADKIKSDNNIKEYSIERKKLIRTARIKKMSREKTNEELIGNNTKINYYTGLIEARKKEIEKEAHELFPEIESKIEKESKKWEKLYSTSRELDPEFEKRLQDYMDQNGLYAKCCNMPWSIWAGGVAIFSTIGTIMNYNSMSENSKNEQNTNWQK